MKKEEAVRIIDDTFDYPFEEERFSNFVFNLFNDIDTTTSRSVPENRIPQMFQSHIKGYKRIGLFSDGESELDILVVSLKKNTALERARTMQRNFVAHYLKNQGEKDSAVVAYYNEDQEDWRFSFVKLEYETFIKDGKVKVEERIPPARRYSFLVGKNEPNHTAKQQLVDIIADDRNNPTLSQLENAFKIESVTKEFFEKYKGLFLQLKEELDALVEDDPVIKKDFSDKNIDTGNFAKKLLGQIVFLYFLQKKGWMGVEADKDWGAGSKKFLRKLFDKEYGSYENFFNDILEPLFYDALAEIRNDDFYTPLACRIPFLNGGLFEPTKDYDWRKTDILIKNETFENILNTFDLYNFTVKEDEPLEKEVAVDPEMLGKVFENLLEVKDRKSKGAFYTPREIVHYMCQESLINYLDTSLEIDREDMEFLIKKGELILEQDKQVEVKGVETKTYTCLMPISIRDDAAIIDKALEKIKICDPAIGSGAFPVGILHEIVKARDVLTNYIKDPKDRTLYDLKRNTIQNSIYGVDIDSSAVDIAKLRLWLSLVVDEDDYKNIKPLPNLDYKIVCGNSLLVVDRNNMFIKIQLSELEEKKKLFFNATHHQTKKKLKREIDKLIIEITDGKKQFDFKVYFSEVWHDRDGFDVVIANPPYVQIKQIPNEDKKLYKERFKSAVGRFNLFYFFLEMAGKLLKQNGCSTFIVPDRLLLNTQCNDLRIWLLKEQRIIEIDSFEDTVFEAVVDNIIIIYKNSCESYDFIKSKNRVLLLDLEKTSSKMIPISHFLDSHNNQFDLGYDPKIDIIVNKINDKSVHLGTIAEIKDGVIQSKIPDLLFLKKPIDGHSKKLLFGKNINRYSISFDNNWINYKPEEMMKAELKRVEGAPGLRLRKTVIFERNKILTRQTADKIIASYDTDGYYYSNTLHGTTITSKGYHPYYVLAIMNSSLTNWYYRTTTSEGGKVFAQVKIAILRILPVFNMSLPEQKPFISIVDKIINIKQHNGFDKDIAKAAEVNELEKQIDQLVYDLYGLTKEEIDIVKNASG